MESCASKCYPGSFVPEIQSNIACVEPPRMIRSEELLKTPGQIETLLARPLGRDPAVFGRMNGLTVLDYFDPETGGGSRDSDSK